MLNVVRSICVVWEDGKEALNAGLATYYRPIGIFLLVLRYVGAPVSSVRKEVEEVGEALVVGEGLRRSEVSATTHRNTATAGNIAPTSTWPLWFSSFQFSGSDLVAWPSHSPVFLVTIR
jgi:hypothetical protein